MSITAITSERMRILVASGRPMAARVLKLHVHLDAGNAQPENVAVAAVTSFLHGELKLAILDCDIHDGKATFHLSTPLPDLKYLESELSKGSGVLDVSHTAHSAPIDVLRPGEELDAVLNGLRGLSKSVEVSVLDHATPQELRDQLNATPGYDILYLVCHGDERGNLLFEDGRGWARYLAPGDLADLVGGKVSVFVLGACFGERSLPTLFEAHDGYRPPAIVYAQGEHPIPTWAVQLFSERFHRSLAEGFDSVEAYQAGLEQVRWDDRVGEVAWPDGMQEGDEGPSPYKRLQLDEAHPVAFTAIAEGEPKVKDLGPSKTPHRKIIRADELMMGRETEILLVVEELLPPRSGLRETKSRLIHLHGEGGIGKTRLAQTVCDVLEDYRWFPGGIYEVDCETVPDSHQLAVSILQALGVEAAEKVRDAIGALVSVLQEATDSTNDLLLMLDNVDPLFTADRAEDTARLLKRLLTECPDVRILSPSRTQLHLGGYESDFLVDPLKRGVAVDLFIKCIPDQDIRARVQSLPDEQMKHVQGLVAALQGHPLSIFLAAHRIVAGPDPIVQRLEQGAASIRGLLEAPELKGVPPRQRSLRASLDLSYNLLSQHGKGLFRKSSLFPGGLYRHVSTLDSLLGEGWRDALQEAGDIGLLRFERDQQRFWMLNPVREYAEQVMLEEDGEGLRKQVSEHRAGFTSLQDFYLNPAQDAGAFARLDLPAELEQRQDRLAELHDAACAALRAEEGNILFAFRLALQDHFEAAEQIASGMVDYLSIYDKRQKNVWMARATLEVSTTPEHQAKWLNNLGGSLSAIGDRQAALDATKESLDHYRRLADKHPEAFLPYVAMTVGNLGNRLSHLGDRQGALDTTKEALGHYRKLANNQPEAFLRYVAATLNNLGARQSEMGDWLGALDATRESLDHYRKLAERHPEVFLPNVAGTLSNLGLWLSKTVDPQGALEATQEALDIRRKLAEKHPEAFLPDVAATLNNLGKTLAESGNPQRALNATKRALDHYRMLAEKHPDAFLPDVATTLSNLGNVLSETGDGQRALDAIREALDIRRKLGEKHPDAFLPDVATTLSNLGNVLSETGDGQGALDANKESLDISRELADKNPEAFLPDVAMTLNNLGAILSELGDWQGALDANKESLDIRRTLAEKHPQAFLPDLAMTLDDLGSRLSDMGDSKGALRYLRELVDVGSSYRDLAGNAALLVQGCVRLAALLIDTGRNLEALPVLDRAAAALEPFAHESSDALRDLIEVNEKRVEILKPQDPSKASQIAQRLERQKVLYAENHQPGQETAEPSLRISQD